MGRLVVSSRGEVLAAVDLDRSIVIGRGAEADLSIADTKLSRRHLAVEVSPEGWIATDLESSNGTRVDGERIRRTLLEDGQVIELGDVSIVFYEQLPVGARERDQLPLRLALPDITENDAVVESVQQSVSTVAAAVIPYTPTAQVSLLQAAGISLADVRSSAIESQTLRDRLNQRAQSVSKAKLLSLGLGGVFVLGYVATQLFDWILNG
jgi:hypothetical protein